LYPNNASDDDNEQVPSVLLASPSFIAVHHSLDSRHLIAIGSRAELIWFRNYRSQKTEADRYQSVVVLRFEEWGNMLIDNLCIENNRVVFSGRRDDYFPTLYCFELRDWQDLADFRARQPEIRLLSGGLPTGFDGISRIEMDSTSIYVTSSHNNAFLEQEDFEAPYEDDLRATWYTISGEAICSADIAPVWPSEGHAPKPEMRDFLSEHRNSRNNCIRVYEFGSSDSLSEGS